METKPLTNGENLQNLVVVGGGTAGWLTALAIKKAQPFADVTLVESEEIGIIGAGEGSTPIFPSFLQYLGIPISDVIQKTGATIKNGIRFTNWNYGDELPYQKPYYYHNFAPHSTLDVTVPGHLDLTDPFLNFSLQQRILLHEHDLSAMLCENDKTPFTYGMNKNFAIYHPWDLLKTEAAYGLHFDASLLANTLRLYGEASGINRVEGKIIDVSLDANGNVNELTLESEEKIPVNFVFDCSGMKRLIINQVYNSEWVSLKDYLPVNAALPFSLPMPEDEDIPTYTESIAMKYGWVWKIPLQHRYGCGYVFDSTQISFEEAQKEVEEYFGVQVTVPRTFSFDPGYNRTPWVNNCIAIGLSANFIEPLEATSIMVTIYSLQHIISDITTVLSPNEAARNRYNLLVENWNKETCEFVYLHYMGKRNDTSFWNKFKDIGNAPEQIQKFVTDLQSIVLNMYDFKKYHIFKEASWISVAAGLGLINYEVIDKFVQDNYVAQKTSMMFYGNRKNDKERIKRCLTQRELFSILSESYGYA